MIGKAKEQLRLFGTEADMELRFRNLLRKLPQGEYGMGQITPYLIRSGCQGDGNAFMAAVETLAKDGLIKLKMFTDAGWSVPGLINRVGRWVEPPRKKKPQRKAA